MLEGKEEAVYCPSRNNPNHYRARASEIIDQWLKDGKIEHAHSSFNSPILIMEKQLKKVQEVQHLILCIDFRELNKRLPHDPIIPEELTKNDIKSELDVFKEDLTSHQSRHTYDLAKTPVPSRFTRMPLV